MLRSRSGTHHCLQNGQIWWTMSYFRSFIMFWWRSMLLTVRWSVKIAITHILYLMGSQTCCWLSTKSAESWIKIRSFTEILLLSVQPLTSILSEGHYWPQKRPSRVGHVPSILIMLTVFGTTWAFDKFIKGNLRKRKKCTVCSAKDAFHHRLGSVFITWAAVDTTEVDSIRVPSGCSSQWLVSIARVALIVPVVKN